jgi:uncharacterized membrane protein YfcA
MFEFFLGLVLLGILAGLLSGFFGIGSGVILVPAYVFLFNLLDLPPEIIPILATGTSMTTMAITIPMAAFIHFKNNNVELEIVKKMFWMAFAMTLLGRYIALFIESSTLQIIIAVSLILAALQIAFDFSPKSKNLHKSSFELIFVAGLLGLVTSFVGIGGGILMVPYFLYKGLNPHKAIGTSSLMGFALAVSGALGALLFAPIASKDIEFFVGSAFVPAVIITGLSSIYFARLGANPSTKTDSRYLKQAFSVLIIIAALRVFYITFV